MSREVRVRRVSSGGVWSQIDADGLHLEFGEWLARVAVDEDRVQGSARVAVDEMYRGLGEVGPFVTPLHQSDDDR